MAQIKVNMTYGASGTLPAVSGANLTTLNATNISSGTLNAARYSGGKILQVVETSDVITLISTTSTTYVTNGIELDITPSATSSKILLLYQHVYALGTDIDSDHMAMTIFRDATNLAGDKGLVLNQVNDAWMPVSMTYLDSPSSTSSLNYEIFFKTSSSGPTCYAGYADFRPASFVALEIGA